MKLHASALGIDDEWPAAVEGPCVANGGAPQQARELRAQFRVAERLAEDHVSPALERSYARQLVADVAEQRAWGEPVYAGDGRVGRADGLEQVEPAGKRQLDVGDDHVGEVLLGL